MEATGEIFRRSSTNTKLPISKLNYKEEEKSHGRISKRKCSVISLNKNKKIEFFPHLEWPLIVSLIRIKSENIKISTGEISNEVRYYIYYSSKYPHKTLSLKTTTHTTS